jgi:nitrite reductase/ring-hydroxylating ferredoxin subunit/DMSO/TMAO reductase YedYZ heme-binding membrane subunit
MSTSYRAVGWNANKVRYDLVAGSAAVASVAAIAGTLVVRVPALTIETVLIRAFGITAFALLHVVLAIGPLARLDRRLLPLLYNRRHLGVLTGLFALAHGVFALIQFHTGGTLDPIVSLLAGDGGLGALEAGAAFPFQPLGAAALAILLLMAATSHDFWLHNLSPAVWKSLHMGVYVAYGLLVLHVLLGVLQGQTAVGASWILAAGAATLLALHTASALREARVDARLADREASRVAADGYVRVCPAADIPDTRARVVRLGDERVAIYRYDGRLSAIGSVCQHQYGPLGEGKVVGGCVVCPWHGYEYRPESGASPPPFTEKVPTYRVRVDGDGVVCVDPRPLAPGTYVEPARVEATS